MNIKNSGRILGGSILLSALFGILAGILLIFLNADILLKIVFVIMGIITVFYSLPGITLGVMSFSTKTGKLTLLLSALSAVIGFLMIFWHSTFLIFFLGAYMIVMPVIEILLAKDKLDQLKAELPKLILGVVMLLLGPAKTLDVLFDIAGWVIIVLTLINTLASLISIKKVQKNTGGRIFVDTTGDGKVDTVYIDTTGDGEADTATKYRENK